jgi:hypothetical protein
VFEIFGGSDGTRTRGLRRDRPETFPDARTHVPTFSRPEASLKRAEVGTSPPGEREGLPGRVDRRGRKQKQSKAPLPNKNPDPEQPTFSVYDGHEYVGQLVERGPHEVEAVAITGAGVVSLGMFRTRIAAMRATGGGASPMPSRKGTQVAQRNGLISAINSDVAAASSWHVLARWCRDNNKKRLDHAEASFISRICSITARHYRPTDRQLAWLLRIYKKLGGR